MNYTVACFGFCTALHYFWFTSRCTGKSHLCYALFIFVFTIFLSSTRRIQVVAMTEEMLESSTVVRVSNLLPNLFYMENYDRRLRTYLASELLTDQPTATARLQDDQVPNSLTDQVYILSVQEADLAVSRDPHLSSVRVPRSLNRAVDVLVAVYDSRTRKFIEPSVIAQAVNRISDTMSGEFGGQVEVIYDVCTPQVSLLRSTAACYACVGVCL